MSNYTQFLDHVTLFQWIFLKFSPAVGCEKFNIHYISVKEKDVAL